MTWKQILDDKVEEYSKIIQDDQTVIKLTLLNAQSFKTLKNQRLRAIKTSLEDKMLEVKLLFPG